MNNSYLENLVNAIESGEKVEHGVRSLAYCYYNSKVSGMDVIACSQVLWDSDVEDVVSTLKAAEVNELYITNQASNMLDVYLMMDDLGLKLRGVVRLENPDHKREMERFGEAFSPEFIPAMKLSFED